MKIFKLIKQKMYHFFRPSFEERLRRFGIVEDLRMSEKEKVRYIKMIEEKRKKIISKDASDKDKK